MKKSIQLRQIFFVLLCFFFTHFVFAQDIKENHQLLWEISGNGLEDPSYLYGTIHITDKRAFEFSDSVLLKLEEVDAFAMELLPNDIMGFMFEEIMTYDPYNEEKWKETIGEERYMQLDEWIKSEMNFSLSNISIDYSWALSFLLQSSGTKPPKEGDKATFLDGYLYQLARIQRKQTLSLEDIKDQIQVNKDLSVDQQVAEIEQYLQVKNKEKVEDEDSVEEKVEKEINTLLDLYCQGDLEKIDSYIKKYDYEGALMKYDQMVKRNVKMADNIEAYTKSQTIFAAVGAAHLAGKGSVIDLLKQKGFTLRPVTAIFTGLAEKYEVKESTEPAKWKTFEIPDVAAQIDMPSKPYSFKIADVPSFFRTYMYPDLGEGLNYMTVSVAFPPSSSAEAIEQMFVDYPIGMTKGRNAKIINQKSIRLGDYRGHAITMLEENTKYERHQVFIRGKTLYINTLTSTQKELLQTENANRFFDSFKINELEVSNAKTIVSKKGAFQINMFDGAKEEIKVASNEDGKVQAYIHLYQHSETIGKSEIIYIANYQEFVAGWFIENDETIFEEYIQNIFERMGLTPEVKDTTFMGFPSKLATVRSPNQNIDLQIVIRGSRTYLFFVLVGGEDLPDERRKFMKSFKLLEEEVSEQQVYKSPINPISFLVFHEPKIDKEELNLFQKRNTGMNSQVIYNSLDKNTGINYATSVYEMIPYIGFENEDSLFNSVTELLLTSDSLITSEKKKNQGVLEWEFVAKPSKVHTFMRGKIILKDGVFYELSAYLPEEELYNEVTNRFFTEVSFEASSKKVDFFSDKGDLLLNDLLSEDNDNQELAMDLLPYYTFEKTSFERLKIAFEKDYSSVEEEKYEVNKALLWQMYEKDSLKIVDYIKANYSEWADTNSCQIIAIEILLDMRQKATVDYAKELLINQTPLINEDVYGVSGILSALVEENDSLMLAESLFPEILELTERTHYQKPIFSLIVNLDAAKRLKKEHLMPYEDSLLKQIEADFAVLDTVSSSQSYYDSDIYIVGYITTLRHLDNKKRIIPLLKQIENFPYNSSLQLLAIEALLEMEEPVSAEVVEALAKDSQSRIELYEGMKRVKKLDLFPESYKTQTALSESDIYRIFINEWEYHPDTLVSLKPRSLTYKGEKYRVFLYKAGLESEGEETYWVLGISGLYSWNKKKLDSTIDYTQISFEPLTDENLEGIYSSLLNDAKKYEERRLERLKEKSESKN